MFNLIKYSGMLAMSVLAFTGVYLLKISLNKTIPTGSNTEILIRYLPQLFSYNKFWLALICYLCALIIYLFLLQNNNVSKIFTTIVGINILFTNLGAILFLGDTFNKSHLLGIFLILVGIYFINDYE